MKLIKFLVLFIGIVSTLFLALSSISKLTSLGPSHFIVLHQFQILKNVVLIGTIENEYFIGLLKVTLSPFDSLIFNVEAIKTYGLDKNTDQEYETSGFGI